MTVLVWWRLQALDDVVDSKTVNHERFTEACHRTLRWIDRCIAGHSRPHDQNLFGIVQVSLGVWRWGGTVQLTACHLGVSRAGLTVSPAACATFAWRYVAVCVCVCVMLCSVVWCVVVWLVC